MCAHNLEGTVVGNRLFISADEPLSMYATNLHSLIFMCSISTLLRSALAQMALPPIACPQYFQYVSDGYTYYGLITLPQVPVGRADVRAHFSQRGLPTSVSKRVLHYSFTRKQKQTREAVKQNLHYPLSNFQ